MPTQAANELLDLIDSLLSSRDYEWARDTLEGISQTVQQTGEATLRQREAVDHIMVGRLRHDVR